MSIFCPCCLLSKALNFISYCKKSITQNVFFRHILLYLTNTKWNLFLQKNICNFCCLCYQYNIVCIFKFFFQVLTMPKQNTHQNGASKLSEGKSLSADQSSANNNSANSVKTGARDLSPTVAKRLPFHRTVTDKILNYLGNIKSFYQNIFKK